MRISLFVLFLVISQTISAQTWVENNAEWHYEFFDPVNFEQGIDRTYHAYDTLIDGKLAKAFIRERNAYSKDNFDVLTYHGRWNIDTNYTYVSNDTIYWTRGSTFRPLLFPVTSEQVYTIEEEPNACEANSILRILPSNAEFMEQPTNLIEFQFGVMIMNGYYSPRIGQCWYSFSTPNIIPNPPILAGSVFPVELNCTHYMLTEQFRFLCFSDDSISVSIPKAHCSRYYPGFNWVDGINVHPEIYPNPTSGEISIDNARIVKLEVYTLTGDLVAIYEDASIQSVDLSSLSAGTYMIRLYNPHNFAFMEKVILTH